MLICTARYLSFLKKRRSLKDSAGDINHNPSKLVCTTDDNTLYSFIGDTSAFFDGKGLKPGSTRLFVPSDLIDSTSQSIDLDSDASDSNIMVSTIQQAQIGDAIGVTARTGTHKVLVIRVTDTRGTAPTRSAATIASDVFTDSLNLVSTTINAPNFAMDCW